MKTMCGTSKATPGWRCTRDIGHDGPCAAVPQCIHLFSEWQYQHNGGQTGCENFSRTCSRCGLIERAASGTESFNDIKKELAAAHAMETRNALRGLAGTHIIATDVPRADIILQHLLHKIKGRPISAIHFCKQHISFVLDNGSEHGCEMLPRSYVVFRGTDPKRNFGLYLGPDMIIYNDKTFQDSWKNDDSRFPDRITNFKCLFDNPSFIVDVCLGSEN